MKYDESSHDQIEVVHDSEEITALTDDDIDDAWPSGDWVADTLEQPTQPAPDPRD